MAKNTAKTVLLVALVLSLLIGVAGCGSPVYYQPPPDTDSTGPNNIQQATHPPLSVSLDYFGVKSTHAPSLTIAPWRVQFYAVVSDGKKTVTFSFPLDGQGVRMNNFNLEDMWGQIIFDTDSVGDYLSISIVAYGSENSAEVQAVLNAFKAFNPSFSTLADFYSKLSHQKELIGIYERKWTKVENWGIADSTYKGDNRDLSFWFRIWSATAPPKIAELGFKPDVKIQPVTLPTNARESKPGLFLYYYYSIKMDLVNNEAIDIPVRWVIECPDLQPMQFYKKEDTLTLTPRQNRTVTTGQVYYFTASGTITGTIKLYYVDVLIDTRPWTVEVVP